MIDQKLERWIAETCADITEEGSYTRLELFQMTDGSPQGTLLETLPLSDDSRGNPEIVAARIWELAEQEAVTLYGMHQRFIVLAYREEAEDYERRFPFKITRLRSSQEQLGGESVPSNETGLTAQMLRHDSENHRLTMLMTGSYAERAEATIARQAQQLEQMQDRHMKVILLQEELLDRRAERELRGAVELQKAKRNDELKGMVISHGTLLFARMMGGKDVGGVPIAALARDTAIGKFVKDLTEEEFSKIFNGLTNEHRLMFMELYKSYRDDEAREQAGKPPVLRDEAEATH